MTRQGFALPLLIGGATTSRAHTAVKIAPAYSGPAIHVLDASRGVGVVSQLLSPGRRDAFVRETAREYGALRTQHGAREADRVILPLGEARRRGVHIDWTAYEPPEPRCPGVTALADYPLAELVPYIDWTPFFQTWELKGSYPAILEDSVVGKPARTLFADARALLERLLAGGERRLHARAVLGLFPANALGDDVEIYSGEDRRTVRAVMHGLRQQFEKGPGRPNLCLADFVASKESGKRDWIGAFAVTAGVGLDQVVAAFERDNDDYASIMAKALADRFAEALAERLHERVRREFWGYAAEEKLDPAALVAERYRGIRPAPGYPACPDHTEKQVVFDLLDATRAAGITLTESYAMLPAAAVSGWYFSHPQSQYFGVGRIGRDQVTDYAARKGWAVAEAERWLAPNLAYERTVG
jgi:5-methyltetrahydrofolate--homocysteine methyltransferase